MVACRIGSDKSVTDFVGFGRYRNDNNIESLTLVARRRVGL